jgi:hypothetical protein
VSGVAAKASVSSSTMLLVSRAGKEKQNKNNDCKIEEQDRNRRAK